MNREKFLSIQKRIRHYSIALAAGMIAVFAMTQLLAGIFQSASTQVWVKYNCFARYWNVLQEADRVLYRYAQTPVQKDREDAAALIAELESDAQTLHDAAGQIQICRLLPENMSEPQGIFWRATRIRRPEFSGITA